jgi:MoaA/NifB/PqqE/SkfB family radical SAM enzyme
MNEFPHALLFNDIMIKTMAKLREQAALLRVLSRNIRVLKAGPRINRFLIRYLRKFRVRPAGGNWIVQSHLPPINSRAYGRFIDEHLLGRTNGPSHAQVGVTNACPQHCAYCYNKGRSGRTMDTTTIKRVIGELKDMGVFWLGLTGGEPLLNKDLPGIVDSAAGECAVKLFTTGSGLTPQLARDLREAGLFSVSVSLDDWREEEHDRARGTPGAFREALRAIEIFKKTDGLHVGVSAVLSREMIVRDEVEALLSFLSGLKIQEAWLSEAKPSVPGFWTSDGVIREAERKKLVALQDRYNRRGEITVNYLGHFEGREHFGCNAGHKMVYVDAFGELSPCVFVPLTFGNVMERPVADIFAGMKRHYPSEESCFINRNYSLLRKYGRGEIPLGKDESEALLREVRFGPRAEFFEIYYH